jgi:pimeloyl-ACP methyl ester carboxylesterase
VRRWLKILLVVLAGIVVLLILNAIAVSNETRDAERNIEGAELIDTSSGTIQVLEEGDPSGSPIVLIHGYTGSVRWFDELAALLGESHRVIRIDAIGHGGSDKPAAGYEIENQARAVAEALAELDVTGATVVGHSMGGTIAVAVAELSPDLATKVVVVDQAVDDRYEDNSLARELGYTPVIGQALSRLTDVAPNSAVRDQFQEAFAPDFNIASGFENPDQVVEDLNEMTYTAFVEAAEAENDYSGETSLDDRLGDLGIPVLVVFGSEDQIYDADEAITPYEDIDGVQVELLEGIGHSPNVEAPEELAPLIDRFAGEAEPAPPPEEPPAEEADEKRNDDGAKKDGDKGDGKKGDGKKKGGKGP